MLAFSFLPQQIFPWHFSSCKITALPYRDTVNNSSVAMQDLLLFQHMKDEFNPQ